MSATAGSPGIGALHADARRAAAVPAGGVGPSTAGPPGAHPPSGVQPTGVLQARGVCAGYVHRGQRTVILDGVDVDLAPGETACLVGPNGAGKSTLLRTLVGSQPPLGGSVLLAGEDITAMGARQRARHLAVVLMDRVDVGFLTVRALVGLGRTPHVGWFGVLGDEDREIVGWALEAAGAAALADRMVHQLSDGERQRVMIARALAQQPRLLVLDEPTAFLDLTRRVELMALLQRLAATTGLAVLMSTHELDLAVRAADALWVVHPGGGFDTAAPEDLALDGTLQRAFATRDVTFDHDAGTFAVARPAGAEAPTVVVCGDPVTVRWACRAVLRAGWRPAPEGSSPAGGRAVAVAAGSRGSESGGGRHPRRRVAADADVPAGRGPAVHLVVGTGSTGSAGAAWRCRAAGTASRSPVDITGIGFAALVAALRSLAAGAPDPTPSHTKETATP